MVPVDMTTNVKLGVLSTAYSGTQSSENTGSRSKISAATRPLSFPAGSTTSFNSQPFDIIQRERSDLSARILEAKSTLERLQSLKIAQESLASPTTSAAASHNVVSQGRGIKDSSEFSMHLPGSTMSIPTSKGSSSPAPAPTSAPSARSIQDAIQEAQAVIARLREIKSGGLGVLGEAATPSCSSSAAASRPSSIEAASQLSFQTTSSALTPSAYTNPKGLVFSRVTPSPPALDELPSPSAPPSLTRMQSLRGISQDVSGGGGRMLGTDDISIVLSTSTSADPLYDSSSSSPAPITSRPPAFGSLRRSVSRRGDTFDIKAYLNGDSSPAAVPRSVSLNGGPLNKIGNSSSGQRPPLLSVISETAVVESSSWRGMEGLGGLGAMDFPPLRGGGGALLRSTSVRVNSSTLTWQSSQTPSMPPAAKEQLTIAEPPPASTPLPGGRWGRTLLRSMSASTHRCRSVPSDVDLWRPPSSNGSRGLSSTIKEQDEEDVIVACESNGEPSSPPVTDCIDASEEAKHSIISTASLTRQTSSNSHQLPQHAAAAAAAAAAPPTAEIFFSVPIPSDNQVEAIGRSSLKGLTVHPTVKWRPRRPQAL
ncbi:hypothetical protein CEUSTIGMA_g10373.t1 [Chlamydomonas eustigma]|uniref:Uncharacterized protein n=1 Tax=Chlamydomonas eustigma TaxID=1157962 RepID=A0A250XIV0_9CHLO|nr:hypothetical protein CEUSTIGMA_g10373.t1 [Chlamydomonas eustigma]|eukprot:GAX82946.1 hypothetical protein CEUSTIGMA_g10373.t1 [Chlamydomonas eustigma]